MLQPSRGMETNGGNELTRIRRAGPTRQSPVQRCSTCNGVAAIGTSDLQYAHSLVSGGGGGSTLRRRLIWLTTRKPPKRQDPEI